MSAAARLDLEAPAELHRGTVAREVNVDDSELGRAVVEADAFAEQIGGQWRDGLRRLHALGVLLDGADRVLGFRGCGSAACERGKQD